MWIETFLKGYGNYAQYLWNEISHPSIHNYFYWLIGISVFFFLVEYTMPWRQSQPKFRRDFWLDIFYMFFNFFLFSLIIYNALSDVVVVAVNQIIIKFFSLDISKVNPMANFPNWAILLIGFIVRDFIQWWIHRLLHWQPFLWNFHKVHHSVIEMGFAAHLRYHWMENIVYRCLEYLPLSLLGIGLVDFFIIHIFTLSIGHYNHSNISIPKNIVGAIIACLISLAMITSSLDIHIFDNSSLGIKFIFIISSMIIGYFLLSKWIPFIFNSPEMHIWHHAKEWPVDKPHGINFGLSLSLWDYIFGTAHMPYDGRDLALGFKDVETFPKSFTDQFTYGFKKKR